ncbi:MAG: hypothetical protein RJA49_3123 [Actinomycetota bacterium]
MAFVALVGCSGGSAAPTASGAAAFPTPAPPDTLLPVIVDTEPPDVTDTLPADAMFGGDPCSALEHADFSGLGTAGAPNLLSTDACEFPLSGSTVLVQLASPDQFARPGTSGQEIAPVDGVGLDAIGVALGDRYEVFVQVENGYFSVTADTRATAVRLAKAAAGRALP